MLPIKIGKEERDLGTCLTTMCPHCLNLGRFSLWQRSAAVRVLGITFFEFGEFYELICSQCKFPKEFEKCELSSAMAAQDLFHQLEAEELIPAEYLIALDDLDFPAYQALRDEAATWLCPSCNEKVPATINGCWKCHSPRPGLQKPASMEEGSLPRLPTAVTRPSNPWE